MTSSRTWTVAAVAAIFVAAWAAAGGPSGDAVLLHWPILIVLALGFGHHLKGGLGAAAVSALVLAILRVAGRIDDWTLVGWQALMYALFGLYPFKFIQVREQRHHHYRTLIEYKRGEMEQLRSRLADVDRKIADAESRGRGGGA